MSIRTSCSLELLRVSLISVQYITVSAADSIYIATMRCRYCNICNGTMEGVTSGTYILAGGVVILEAVCSLYSNSLLSSNIPG